MLTHKNDNKSIALLWYVRYLRDTCTEKWLEQKWPQHNTTYNTFALAYFHNWTFFFEVVLPSSFYRFQF